MKKTNTNITIGLLWHSMNSDNLGIGALTVGQITTIDALADEIGLSVHYKVLGWGDLAPYYIQRSDVEMAPMRARDLIRPSGLYRTVKKCDLILDISAGDSFADIYGAQRFGFNSIAKLAVLAARRPLILSPQTIGPFQRWWSRLIAGLIMRRARVVVTRDALSTEFLRPFNLGTKVIEATDVAFRLPYEPAPKRPKLPIRVGFNISGLLFNGGYTRDDMFSLSTDYPRLAREMVAHFSKLPDCELHLIGHVNSLGQEVEDDYRVAQRLAEEFPGAIVAPRFKSPSDAKSYIATMDFFCGSRMHACIAAFSSGVPVLPIAYSRKFTGLFQTLGYDRLADCKTQSADQILKAVIDAYQERNKLKVEVEKGCKIANEKLTAYDTVLRKHLEGFKNSTQ